MNNKKPIFTYHFPSTSKVPSASTASSDDNFWNWWIPEEFRYVKSNPSLKKPKSVYSSTSSSSYTTPPSSMTTPSPPSSVCSSGYSYSPLEDTSSSSSSYRLSERFFNGNWEAESNTNHRNAELGSTSNTNQINAELGSTSNTNKTNAELGSTSSYFNNGTPISRGLERLFWQLTSRKMEFRKKPDIYVNDWVNRLPLWCKYYGENTSEIVSRCTSEKWLSSMYILAKKKYRLNREDLTMSHFDRTRKFIEGKYKFGEWIPFVSKHRASLLASLKYKLHNKTNLGFSSLGFDFTRLKKFNLGISNAISYSAYTDARFNVFLSTFYGFTIWGVIVHPSLLALDYGELYKSVDIGAIVNAVKDTYTDKICSSHPSNPLPCGECISPVNRVVKDLIPDNIDPVAAYSKHIALMVGAIILMLFLTESVSPNGILVPLVDAGCADVVGEINQ
jgi:hypothetical protein